MEALRVELESKRHWKEPFQVSGIEETLDHPVSLGLSREELEGMVLWKVP